MQIRPQKKAKKKKTHTFVVLMHQPRHAPLSICPLRSALFFTGVTATTTLILAELLIPTTHMPVGHCLLDALALPFFFFLLFDFVDSIVDEASDV